MLVKIQENFYDENKKLILDKSYWAGEHGHYATYEKLHACLRIIRNPQLLDSENYTRTVDVNTGIHSIGSLIRWYPFGRYTMDYTHVSLRFN